MSTFLKIKGTPVNLYNNSTHACTKIYDDVAFHLVTCTIPLDYVTEQLRKLKHSTSPPAQMPGSTYGIVGIPSVERGILIPELGFRGLRRARQWRWPAPVRQAMLSAFLSLFILPLSLFTYCFPDVPFR